jgi:hypothetical protein
MIREPCYLPSFHHYTVAAGPPIPHITATINHLFHTEYTYFESNLSHASAAHQS